MYTITRDLVNRNIHLKVIQFKYKHIPHLCIYEYVTPITIKRYEMNIKNCTHTLI